MYAGVGLEASFRLVEELLFMCRVVVSVLVASVLHNVVLMFSQMPFRLGSSGGGTGRELAGGMRAGHVAGRESRLGRHTSCGSRPAAGCRWF